MPDDGTLEDRRIPSELLELVLDGRGIQLITRRLSELIGNPVAVADLYFHNLAASTEGSQSDPLWDQALRNGGAPRAILDDAEAGRYFSDAIRSQASQIIPTFPSLGMTRRRLLSPIVGGSEVLGYLTVLEADRPLEDIEPNQIREAVFILAIELLNRRAQLETEVRLLGDVLGELFTSPTYDRRSILHRSSILHVDLLRPWSLLLVGLDWTDDSRLEQTAVNAVAVHRRLFDCVRRTTAMRFPGVVPIPQGADIVLLCPLSAALGEDQVDLIAKGISAELRWQLPANSVSVSIGGPCTELQHFGPRYSDARKALELNRSLHRRSSVVRLEDFGLSALLYRPENPDELRRFADRHLAALVEHDSLHGTQLLMTLQAYLLSGCAFRATSRRLGIHLNTLRGRLARAAKVSGADLTDPATRVALYVAVEIYRHCGGLPNPIAGRD